MTGGYRRVFVILCWLMFSVDQCPGTTSLLSTSLPQEVGPMTRRSSSTLISGLSCAFWWLWQVSSWIPPSDLKVSNSFWSRTIPICRLEAFEIQPVEWANVAISLNSGHGMDKLMNGEMLLGGIHSVPRVLENHHWHRGTPIFRKPQNSNCYCHVTLPDCVPLLSRTPGQPAPRVLSLGGPQNIPTMIWIIPLNKLIGLDACYLPCYHK